MLLVVDGLTIIGVWKVLLVVDGLTIIGVWKVLLVVRWANYNRCAEAT